MRILHVVIWDGGGVPTAMGFVANQLQAKNVKYDAFCFNGWNPDSRWAEFCERLYTNREISLTELAVKEQYDVIQIIDGAYPAPYDANLWISRACYTGGVVCVSQNTIPFLLPHHTADVFLACSDSSRDVLAKTVTAPIRVIPNGVDTSRFYRRETEHPLRPIIAWVGRAADFKQKDIHGFLHLAARLYESEYDFWIADADNDPALFGLADWLGSRIQYHSQLMQDEMPVFYNKVAASGGAVVSTSRFEGLPFSLLEAAACGCPVIAPNAPGMEYLENGKTGLLYEREDALPTILKHLIALKNPVFRDRLVEQAHQAIQTTYNSEKMAQGYYQAYQDAIKTAKLRRPRERWRRVLWARALQIKRNLAARQLKLRQVDS